MQRPQINNFALPSAALSFMHSEEAGLLCVCELGKQWCLLLFSHWKQTGNLWLVENDLKKLVSVYIWDLSPQNKSTKTQKS